MQGRKSFFRWLTGWLLLCMLGVAVMGAAGLSTRAAPRPASALDVIISEVAWGGTAADSDDQWIELYNPSVVDIDLTGWTLQSTDGTPSISLSGNILAGDYFLLERNDDTTVSDVAADLIYLDTEILGDTVEVLELRDDSNNLIDTANLGSAAWFAGSGAPNYYTMERKAILADILSAWASNDGITINGLDANSNSLNGTPKQQNSAWEVVIISEVAWAGTQATTFDEWIELHNPGGSAIALTGWKIEAADGDPSIALSGTIAAGGYYLLERSDSFVITDVVEDLVYTGSLLTDTGEALYLLAPDRSVIDTANNSGDAWPAGGGSNAASMERIKTGGVVEKDSIYAWATNVGTVMNGHDAAGNDIYGTPGQENWVFTVLPTPSPVPTATPTPTDELAVVINEVAWAGTQASTSDEWIELYNPGSSDINLANWTLTSSDGSPDITLSGIIQGDDYFLLERTDDDTVASIAADLIYSGSLSNSGEILRLYDPNNNLVDTANINGSAWPAGISSTYSSMERSVIDDDSDYVWVTYDAASDAGTRATDASGYEINGTPDRGNEPINVTPTVTPQGYTSGSGGTSGSSGGSGSSGSEPPILGISEFLPRPGHDWNNDGLVDVFDEFIEIINAGKIDVDLGNYKLDDEENLGSSPYTLPKITLKPGERAVFYAAETGILLSDAGDTVRLLRSSKVVDAYTYGVARYPDQAWCRIPDRLGYWNKPCFPTPNNPNALTGTFPSPPVDDSGYRVPICLLPDTTPQVFVYAECDAPGAGIWSWEYWDGLDAAERLKLGAPEKWETVFE